MSCSINTSTAVQAQSDSVRSSDEVIVKAFVTIEEVRMRKTSAGRGWSEVSDIWIEWCLEIGMVFKIDVPASSIASGPGEKKS